MVSFYLSVDGFWSERQVFRNSPAFVDLVWSGCHRFPIEIIVNSVHVLRLRRFLCAFRLLIDDRGFILPVFYLSVLYSKCYSPLRCRSGLSNWQSTGWLHHAQATLTPALQRQKNVIRHMMLCDIIEFDTHVVDDSWVFFPLGLLGLLVYLRYWCGGGGGELVGFCVSVMPCSCNSLMVVSEIL